MFWARAFFKIFIFPFLVLTLVGCANPSIVDVNNEAFTGLQIQTIYVPRFEGNPAFVEEGTDYFVVELESRTNIKIIQGGPIRLEGEDILAGGNTVSPEQAIAIAREKGADAVILGKVTSHKTDGLLNGFSTIRLISVETGEVLARFHRPSGMLIAHSEHQTVMAAVKRTAEDLAEVLK